MISRGWRAIESVVTDECVSEQCERCDAMQKQVDAAREEAMELAQQVTMLETQLAEVTKLCELQQADLERYRQAYEASRPNHPERAPKDQLQLAFERVLEMLGTTAPANDDEEEQDQSEREENDEPGPGPAGGANDRRKRKKRDPHGRRKFDTSNLPVIEDRIVPDEVKAAGGEGYELIGEEVSERVALRPAEWVRYRLVRLKYKVLETEFAIDPADSNEAAVPPADGGTRIMIAPLPASLWPNTMADASAVGHVILSKYGDLLPLHRQQGIAARSGFHLPKSTQCSWLKTAHGFCEPVVDAMLDDAKKHAFLIATDATGARVLPARSPPGLQSNASEEQVLPAERRRCDRWHVFVFIADRDHVVFRYDRENNGAVFSKILQGYRGNLLADAASVFDVLYNEHGMTEHGCWFHCRRPFYRALETDPLRALEALSLIGKLFEVDRELRGKELDLVTFTRLRRERAEPVLALFDQWIELNRDEVDPRSPLALAIGYYENQRDALHRFLGDGRIRLDNNLSEQALRNLVVGLSNWMFFANETGIAWYTTFRSLIASCVLHRLHPAIYLEQLLRIVPHWPKNRVIELAPKYWTSTVEQLDASWRSILARPWEPDVILSAQIASPDESKVSSSDRAA